MDVKMLVVLVIVACVCGGFAEDTTPETTTKAATTSTTTTPKADTTTTTAAATTTTASTEAPSTTTTTTTEKTTTTTTATTTTTKAPAPAPKPIVDPGKPTAGIWNYSDSSNDTNCIITKMAVQMTFNYTATDNKVKSIAINLPVNKTTATGVCGANSSQISITFKKDWILSLNFSRSGKSYFVNAVELVYTADNTSFPNMTEPDTETAMKTHLTFAKTDSTKIYVCQSEEELQNFTTSGNETKLTKMAFYDMKVAAFQNLTITNFNKTQNNYSYCSDDTKINNIVPIVVGAALAGLVVIVLVAYLIGRRRRMTGYESV